MPEVDQFVNYRYERFFGIICDGVERGVILEKYPCDYLVQNCRDGKSKLVANINIQQSDGSWYLRIDG